MKSLYTAKVSVTSGRDGAAKSADGRLDVHLGFPKELGGAGDKANPEQLFVAGYAACFASSLKAAAAKAGTKLGAVAIDAEGTLSLRDDGSYLISSVRLVVRLTGLETPAEPLVAEAKRICAYSNATRGNTLTDVVLA